MDWGKIFTNDANNKRSIFKIYKSFIKSNNRKKKQLDQNMGRRLKRYFSKEDIQMCNRHTKRCLTSLITGERKIKTTIRYHLTPAKRAIIKKPGNEQMLERVWRKGKLPTLLLGM